MRTERILGQIILTLLFSTSMWAGDFSVAGSAGTLGGGVAVSYQLSDHFKTRLNYYGAGAEDFKMKDIGDLRYEADGVTASVGMLLDYYPFQGKFYISLGAYYQYADIDLENDLNAAKRYRMGSRYYSAYDIGSLSGDVSLDSLNPYAGVGWNIPFTPSKRWEFSVDLGMIYQTNDAEVTLRSDDSPLQDNAQYREDLRREENKMEKDLEYSVYPVVSVGVGYKF